MKDDEKFLKQAIDKSKESVAAGGFPVGVVIIKNNEIIASAISNGKQLKDPTAHGEVTAIREACQKLGKRDIPEVTLYSSLEPCLMCLAASSWASIPRIIYACSRGRVSKQHFEGTHDLQQINAALRKPISLVHGVELEDEALKVIADWEKSLK
jgi:guanine deaminase